MTIENPVSQPIGPRIVEARVGVYRYEGLGGWGQTATVVQAEELQLLVATPSAKQARAAPPPPLPLRGHP